MQRAALGFRVHSGWTAAVAVTLADGTPAVLSRQKIELVNTFTYKFRQPYHTAKRIGLKDAPKFVAGVQADAIALALAAIAAVQNDLNKNGCKLTHCALLQAAGRALPALDKILASHALIHTADGELFRNSIANATETCGLSLTKIKERELLDQASAVLRIKPDALQRRLTDLGRPLGPPWSQDEKLSALAAWLCLASP
ncbi:MAG TPA: hypothetical protein VH139_10250 [Acidobacteriaceae bacterium]|nr:hypothetical protein [Acidobacteriaceae bacterium]